MSASPPLSPTAAMAVVDASVVVNAPAGDEEAGDEADRHLQDAENVTAYDACHIASV